MILRRPRFVGQLSSEAGASLARLTGLEGFARSILVGVLPLIALKTFESKEVISSVYFVSALFTLFITVNLATLERLMHRRWLLTMGGVFLVVSGVFFYLELGVLFAIGVGARSAAASIFAVCISLYIMDYIGKKELARNESKRMVYTGLAWLVAPALGVWIYENSQPAVIYIISGLLGLGVIAYFWRLRLGDDVVIQAARSVPKNPLRSIGRFASQPRLRISYMITLSRACFWAALFVYGPIYVVEAELPTWVGAALLSGSSGLLFFAPVVNRLTDHFGTRQVIIAASVLLGMSMVGLGVVGEPRPIGLLFWSAAAIGAATIDVLGNIPFMRLVKPYERSEMTMVFTTWRETSSLLTQALVFLTLLVAPFWAFYFVLATLQFASAVYTSFLPKRI